jgi:hypothetical protein
MSCLLSLTKQCGTQLPPGAKLKAYWIPISELDGWPETRAELTQGTPAQGDTKILDEPFDFVDTVGKGFWRELSAILVDTPSVTNNLEGQIGGQGYRQRYNFFIPLNNAPALEWLDCLVANSGCTVWMVPTKDGNYHVIGDPDNGVFVEVVEGGTGTSEDRLGYNVTIYANTGYTTLLYDADEHGINLTPNPAQGG